MFDKLAVPPSAVDRRIRPFHTIERPGVQRDDDDALIREMDDCHARISSAERQLFRLIRRADRRELWRGSGARDLAHWLSMRYGISQWKARRWIAAAHALGALPRLSESFSQGELGIDKVVELARFATSDTEARLIRWARGVSCVGIRRRADLELRQSIDEVRSVERARSLSWWYFDEGRRFGLEAELPAAQGAVVARAIERLADTIPVLPGEEDPLHADARRADALVAVCSTRIAQDADADRATVIVHVRPETLAKERGSALEGGGVLHPETVRRLLCDGRIQSVVEDAAGQPIGLGRTSREPSPAMVRQLRYRDGGCTFPRCGSIRYTQAHHVVWWERGGRTDLDNLVLLCTFHHRLVHEHGWTVSRERDGEVRWARPDGVPYRPGAPAVAESADGVVVSSAS
jgi:hypothetical protein